MSAAIAPPLALDFEREHVAMLETYRPAGLLHGRAFQADCTRIEKRLTEIYGSRGRLVFGRLTP